jgi:hypothetical protein
MKIIHCGLPRTGTNSLAAALERLGFRVVNNPIDSHTITQLKIGNWNLKVLEEADAITDLPSSIFFEEFDQQFPGSKFVMTTRPKHDWLNSCRKLWEVMNLNSIEGVEELNELTKGSSGFLYPAMWGCVSFNQDRFSRVYDRWYSRVREYLTRYHSHRDWCRIDITWPSHHKWSQLCELLDKPIPSELYPWIKTL